MTDAKVNERASEPWISRRTLMFLLAFAALSAVYMLLGWTHMLIPEEKGGSGGLKDLNDAVNNIKGPATVVFGSLSGLGLVAGGAMSSMGIQQGIRVMLTAGLAGGGVLLGNGLIK